MSTSENLANHTMALGELVMSSTGSDVEKDNNEKRVPSFRELLYQIGISLDNSDAYHSSSWQAIMTVKEEDDKIIQLCASSSSNTSGSSSSTNSTGASSNAHHTTRDNRDPPLRHDFWTTVLGPSQTLVKKQGRDSPAEVTQKPHACEICPMRFKKRCNLQSHLRSVHEKLRPFLCTVCSRKFGRKSNCAKHVRHSIH